MADRAIGCLPIWPDLGVAGQTASTDWYLISLVPGGGLEPPHCYQRRILNPLRLPIPPSRQGAGRERVWRQKPRIIAESGRHPQGGGYNRAPCASPTSISIC